MVRFATTCDRCQARSDEYTAWPSCRECLDDICPDCAAPGTLVETDGEGPDRVTCRTCHAERPGDIALGDGGR